QMKKVICFLILAFIFSCTKQEEIFQHSSGFQKETHSNKPVQTARLTGKASLIGWSLIFQDEFETDSVFDSNKWSFCPRSTPDWTKYLTSTHHYVHVSNDNLQLILDNQVITGDPVAYHSGGIQTYGKFSFTYGKVKVRAKFTQGQGAWPAIWMMPESAIYGGWPNSGEIDIMEHLNNDSYIYQTLHGQSLSAGHAYTKAININQYNT